MYYVASVGDAQRKMEAGEERRVGVIRRELWIMKVERVDVQQGCIVGDEILPEASRIFCDRHKADPPAACIFIYLSNLSYYSNRSKVAAREQ